jgi:hypothetical protein
MATWVMILGAIFGGITLIGLFVFAYLASKSPDFVCNSILLLAAVFALGAALSAGFIGGAASATGQFGDTARNNSLAFSVGGGIAVLIIVFLAVQYFRPTNCEQKTPVHGSLDYQILDPPTSDLEIQLVGSNNEPIYTWDTGNFEKLFVYVTQLEQININVRNRPLYKRCSEEVQDPILSRKRSNLTKYKIMFADKAYRPQSDRYYIAFFYNPLVPGAQPQDQLTIKNLANIDRDKLKAEVQHSPENCLTDTAPAGSASSAPFVLWADGQDDMRSTRLAAALPSLIDSAQAQQLQSVDPMKLLSSPDKSLSSRAQKQIAANPGQYVQAIDALLSSGMDERAILNVLDALRDASPATYRLPDASLLKLLQLTYSGSPQLRQGIRSYLLDFDIIDTKLADLAKEFLTANSEKLRSDLEKYMQLTFLIRDIYYNAGYRSVVDFRGDYGERERRPNGLRDAKRMFGLGVDLIGGVPAEQNVTFGKAYYGLTLAQYSEAVMQEAERSLGPNASSRVLEDHILTLMKRSGTPIPFSSDQRSAFLNTIASFLDLVNGRESQYLWPDHIKQLRSCKQNPTYTCYSATS